MKTLTIGPNDAGQRLDKFLTKAMKNLPMSMLYKGIRTKKIKVNRKRAYIDQMLCEGDTIELFLPPDLLSDTPAPAFTKLTPRLNIVYEDEQIMLLNKRPGLLVHSDAAEDTNTLISHVKAYLYRKGEYDPAKEQSFAPALVNRIDRNTGGIVIAAKTAASLRILNQKMKDREIKKQYLCAAHGIFDEKEGLLTGWLRKDSDANQVTIYTKKPTHAEGVKSIRTAYRVIAEKQGDSLLEIDLLTGRTHQIRAHLASVGHPLVGDGKYGVNRDDKKLGYKFQALCAYRLTFKFTTDGGILNYLSGKTFELDQSDIWFMEDFA